MPNMTTADFLLVERVAEGLWQTINGIDGIGLAAHKAWLAVPQKEKQQWRVRAEVAIADWRKTQGHE